MQHFSSLTIPSQSAAPGFLALFVSLVVLFSVFCIWLYESSVRIWNNSEMLLSHQLHFLSYHRQVPLKILQKRYVTGFYSFLNGELKLEIYVELTEEFSERSEGWQSFYIHFISEILPFFKKWTKRWHNVQKHWFVGFVYGRLENKPVHRKFDAREIYSLQAIFRAPILSPVLQPQSKIS